MKILQTIAASSLSLVGCSGILSYEGPLPSLPPSPAPPAVSCRYATAATASSSADLSGTNVMSVNVGSGALCGTRDNFPCTSVTICPVGSSTGCQTISDILVDTGSFGLRIFVQALNPTFCETLQQVTDDSGNAVAECAMFGSFNVWGSVLAANVQLGGEAPVKASIHLIDKNFATVPTACAQVGTSPQSAGYNGILGVGLKQSDCGTTCETVATNNMYYNCTRAGTCTGTALKMIDQVTNPVALLPVDNNGVLLDLPSVPGLGSPSVTGSLYLGIGTRTNNAVGSATVYTANSLNEFQTVAFSQTYGKSFIDSGSNTLSIPTNSGLATCTGGLAAFYCPTGAPLSLTASTTGLPSGNTGTVSYSLANAQGYPAGNHVFGNLGSVMSFGLGDTAWIWGLPFFLGRRVFVGIQGKSSVLGMGPYWGY